MALESRLRGLSPLKLETEWPGSLDPAEKPACTTSRQTHAPRHIQQPAREIDFRAPTVDSDSGEIGLEHKVPSASPFPTRAPNPSTSLEARTDAARDSVELCKHQAPRTHSEELLSRDHSSVSHLGSHSALGHGKNECTGKTSDPQATGQIIVDIALMQDMSWEDFHLDESHRLSQSAPSSYAVAADMSRFDFPRDRSSHNAPGHSDPPRTHQSAAEHHHSEEHDSVPPLRPGLATSPPLNAASAPSQAISETSTSPTAASSPIPFPALSTSGSLASPRPAEARRSSSYHIERVGSVRRQSRRTSARSARSGSMAQSPAGSWLSMWNREESTPAVQPDDEGQPVGENNEYVLGRQVGYGGFSIVKEAHTFENGEPVLRAVKIVRKQADGREDPENEKLQIELQHEISIWKQLKHPHILRLLGEYSNSFGTFCFTQMTSGGTLFEYVRRHRQLSSGSIHERALSSSNNPSGTVPFSEAGMPLRLSRRYLHQLASALFYLHRHMELVHRDIKLENCLLNFPRGEFDIHEGGEVLLCDFGMADHIVPEMRDEAYHSSQSHLWDSNDDVPSPVDIGPSGTSTSITGSLQYASPELIRAGRPLFEPAVDIWAYGVVSHALLTAELPFTHHFMPILQKMILKGEWNVDALIDSVHQKYPEFDGRDAKSAIDLTVKCLEMDMARRWTIENVLSSAFLLGNQGLEETHAQL